MHHTLVTEAIFCFLKLFLDPMQQRGICFSHSGKNIPETTDISGKLKYTLLLGIWAASLCKVYMQKKAIFCCFYKEFRPPDLS